VGTLASCPSCGFPVMAEAEGQTKVCAGCGEKMIATLSTLSRISQVNIPSPLFWGVLAFSAGVILGPSILASTNRGQAWLLHQARGG